MRIFDGKTGGIGGYFPKFETILIVSSRHSYSHMECLECGSADARRVEVRYTSGDVEVLTLCETCEAEYESGGFVSGTGDED